jgi:hypothetical protein
VTAWDASPALVHHWLHQRVWSDSGLTIRFSWGCTWSYFNCNSSEGRLPETGSRQFANNCDCCTRSCHSDLHQGAQASRRAWLAPVNEFGVVLPGLEVARSARNES